MTALGGLWYVFRKIQVVENNTKRLDELEAKWDTILDQLQRIHITQENVRVSLFGVDGSNGLRSELREVKEWMHDYIRTKMDEK